MANILIMEDSSLVGFGGGQKMTLTVADALSEHHTLLFSDFTDSSTYTQYQKQKFPSANFVCLNNLRSQNRRLQEMSYWKQITKSITNIRILRKAIKLHKIDCLYATTRMTAIYCLILHILCRVPYVYHAHLVQWKDVKLKKLWNAITRNATAVLCVSNRVKDSLSEGNKILLYNPSINYRGYKGKRKQNNDWTVAFVGSLIEIKGVAYIIEAAKLLPDVSFLIYGKGPLEEELKANSPTNVIFKGFCNDVISELYLHVDIIVVSTIIEEALSLTAVDAKSVGLPVVVTNIGGQSEIVRDGIDGIKVPVKDAKAIADAIKRITDSEDEYHAMALSSYESSSLFSYENFKTVLTQVFDSI